MPNTSASTTSTGQAANQEVNVRRLTAQIGGAYVTAVEHTGESIPLPLADGIDCATGKLRGWVPAPNRSTRVEDWSFVRGLNLIAIDSATVQFVPDSQSHDPALALRGSNGSFKFTVNYQKEHHGEIQNFEAIFW
jgi:hypothetical protein